jgi:hypothetical protein
MNRYSENSPLKPLIFTFLVLAAGVWLTASARAQDTNLYPGWCMTRLEAAQTNTGRVIIKAASPIGSVVGHGGTVAVVAMEITDTVSGQKEHGVAVTLFEGDQTGGSALVDYDELDSLLNGLDYLSRVDWTVTSLASLNAFFITKDGFRTAAFSSKRTGTIEYAVRALRSNQRPALLTRDQVAQLRSLIQQAKSKLDSLGTK